MQKVKQWEFKGFNNETREEIDKILMNDDHSYWFHFRSIPWYQIRRIAIETPLIFKNIVLNELNIPIEVVISKKTGDLFSKWIIKPTNQK
jgi:hypothetical protein